jgi:hypothetical protein
MHFETYEQFVSLIFQFYGRGYDKLQILKQQIWGHGCIYKSHWEDAQQGK